MTCGVKRIINFDKAFPFQAVTIIDENGEDVTGNQMFAWSTDHGVCWSGWASYDEYCRITPNLDSDFYLRILIQCGIGSVMLNHTAVDCYNISLYGGELVDDPCSNPNVFLPYQNLDCALQLQQRLSDMVCCMFGIPVIYFRVDPDETTKDYTFKEYVVHNIVGCKQIKIMVQDGEMPSSNPHLTEMDFQWEMDWDVEVGKTAFATAFGDTAFPKERDFVWIPMMKRMYQVCSAYDEKKDGLMWRSTTWHLSLNKYEHDTNNNESHWDGIIDNLVAKKYDDVFGIPEQKEQERTTATTQAPFNNLQDIYMKDAIRAHITPDMDIVPGPYCHHNNIISRNVYIPRTQNAYVGYQKPICGSRGTISFIINLNDPFRGNANIMDFGRIKIEVAGDDESIHIGTKDQYVEVEEGFVYLVVFRWSATLNVQELILYKHIHETDFPLYVLKPEMYWFDLDHPIRKMDKYNQDYTQQSGKCSIHPYPFPITNIKYYNTYLDNDLLKEILKYSTTDKRCVFADLARPLDGDLGRPKIKPF